MYRVSKYKSEGLSSADENLISLSFLFYCSLALCGRREAWIKCIPETFSRRWSFTFYSDISPNSPLIFKGGQKAQNLASIFDTTRLWAIRNSKWRKISEIYNKPSQHQWWPYVLPNLVNIGPRNHENRPEEMTPVKLNGKNALNRLQLSSGLFYFVQIWYRVWACDLLQIVLDQEVKRSRGQRPTSQHDVMLANIC